MWFGRSSCAMTRASNGVSLVLLRLVSSLSDLSNLVECRVYAGVDIFSNRAAKMQNLNRTPHGYETCSDRAQPNVKLSCKMATHSGSVLSGNLESWGLIGGTAPRLEWRNSNGVPKA